MAGPIGVRRLDAVPLAQIPSATALGRVPAGSSSATHRSPLTPGRAAITTAGSEVHSSSHVRLGCVADENARPDAGVPTVGAGIDGGAEGPDRCISRQHVGRAAAGAAAIDRTGARTLTSPMHYTMVRPSAATSVASAAGFPNTSQFVTPQRGFRQFVSPSPLRRGNVTRKLPAPEAAPYGIVTPLPTAPGVPATSAAPSNGLLAQPVVLQFVRLSPQTLPGVSRHSMLADSPVPTLRFSPGVAASPYPFAMVESRSDHCRGILPRGPQIV